MKNIIEKNAGQRNALDQVLAAFVLATEQIKIINPFAAADHQEVVAPVFLYAVTPGPEH
jgi:hypothetical protein